MDLFETARLLTGEELQWLARKIHVKIPKRILNRNKYHILFQLYQTDKATIHQLLFGKFRQIAASFGYYYVADLYETFLTQTEEETADIYRKQILQFIKNHRQLLTDHPSSYWEEVTRLEQIVEMSIQEREKIEKK